MGSLDFCPYDGKKIEFNNLAYELIFSEGWDWSRIKSETVISERNRSYILEHDMKRQEKLDFVDRERHVMLLANPDRQGKSGLTLLRELLENGRTDPVDSSERHDKNIYTDARGAGTEASLSYGSLMRNIYSMSFDNEIKSQNETYVNNGIWDFRDDAGGKLKLHYEYVNNRHVFLNEQEDPVMYALPCCPYCHNRLPVGWTSADDFIGISLMGPDGSGKTSFLYSLFNNRANSLAQTFLINDKTLSIRPAHYEQDKKDTIYAHITEQAAHMCRDNGQCPDVNTDKGNMPVFLMAQYGEGDDKKTLIAGIYDNAAMEIEQLDTIAGAGLRTLADRMYGDIFMFDPRDMDIDNISPRKIAGSSSFRKCSVLSIEEQAELQKSDRDSVIKAKDLLNASESSRYETGDIRKTAEHKQEMLPVLEMYKSIRNMYMRYGYSGITGKRHFAGVIAKADLFRGHLGKSYDSILYAGESGTQNIKQITDRGMITEKLIREYKLIGEAELGMINRDYDKHVSWHSISATGCDVVEQDHLLGEYSPVNIGDPVIACIVFRMKAVRWI